MKLNLFKLLFISLLVLFGVKSNSQERVIHGIIHTFDSIPLIGAEIVVKSTKQVILTDTLGTFAIGCNNDDKLKITANGFFNENIKISKYTKFVAVNLRLKPGEKNREYAIGYGHVSDRDKLSSVSNLNKNDLDFSQYSNMYDLIAGRFAGVQIINGEIIIRGVNSINSSSAALIVVDGVPSSNDVLNSLPPVQVKNISIIKDASSAIYGARGANGVVIIETKKGSDT